MKLVFDLGKYVRKVINISPQNLRSYMHRRSSSITNLGILDKGPSINLQHCLRNNGSLAFMALKAKEGGYKIGKLSQHRLWMVPDTILITL